MWKQSPQDFRFKVTRGHICAHVHTCVHSGEGEMDLIGYSCHNSAVTRLIDSLIPQGPGHTPFSCWSEHIHCVSFVP